MKRMPLVLFSAVVILLFPVRSFGTMPDSLRASADYSKDGIGIIVSITPDRDIFAEWAKPQMPKISTSTSYKRGEHVIPLIVYSFDSQARIPYPGLSYNITIFKPDGTEYGKFEHLLIFEGGSVPPENMYLLKQHIDIGLEQNDPVGVYKVHIIIFAEERQFTKFSDLSFEVTD